MLIRFIRFASKEIEAKHVLKGGLFLER